MGTTGGDVTIPEIPVGHYILQFTTGRMWDAARCRFNLARANGQFEELLSFTETSETNENETTTVYSLHEVTLHGVPNGNVRKRGITDAEFDK